MKRLFLLFMLFVLGTGAMNAQSQIMEDVGIPQNLRAEMGNGNVFAIKINDMSDENRQLLNDVAAQYRNNDRSIIADIGHSMLIGGITAVVNVITEEIIKLTQLRSIQKKKWQEMRNKECLFIDSLESVKVQNDFYARGSSYGPLDPTDMRFDGITFISRREGKDVLRMVCRLDTARIDHLFLHSKFHLVLDTLVFYPYNSYLPNLSANNIKPDIDKLDDEEMKEYYETISMFDYDELGDPTITINMDITSSWINEQVQVYHDVRLGSFTLEIPVPQSALTDSVYVYSRTEALAGKIDVIDILGDCFVVPRSYMPGSAYNPSWGTGEYKMKLVMTQKARYKADGNRAKNWHKDYKRLVRLQNEGKTDDSYWKSVRTTFIDKSGLIMKSTVTPLFDYGVKSVSDLVNGTSSAASVSTSGAGGAPK